MTPARFTGSPSSPAADSFPLWQPITDRLPDNVWLNDRPVAEAERVGARRSRSTGVGRMHGNALSASARRVLRDAEGERFLNHSPSPRITHVRKRMQVNQRSEITWHAGRVRARRQNVQSCLNPTRLISNENSWL
jgi:hypothetical protein